MTDYHQTRDYYAAIAAVLMAGDIRARVVSNPLALYVEVVMLDGSTVLWTNFSGTQRWSWTIIRADGFLHGRVTEKADSIDVADAARMIALFDYPAPPEFPRRSLDELTGGAFEA